MARETVRIKLLGNAFEFAAGEEYDVETERGMALVGMGYAVQIIAEPAKKPAAAKE